MTIAVLGLGGNIGDVERTMATAIKLLAAHDAIEVQAVSTLFLTPPWGNTDQPDFLNAAVRIETSLQPRDLLAAILDAERTLGRERGERWGPRSIDIDILLFGAQAVDEPGLTVPHPRLTKRAFALAPIEEVMPGAEIAGRPAADWLAESDRTGLERAAAPGWHEAE